VTAKPSRGRFVDVNHPVNVEPEDATEPGGLPPAERPDVSAVPARELASTFVTWADERIKALEAQFDAAKKQIVHQDVRIVQQRKELRNLTGERDKLAEQANALRGRMASWPLEEGAAVAARSYRKAWKESAKQAETLADAIEEALPNIYTMAYPPAAQKLLRAALASYRETQESEGRKPPILSDDSPESVVGVPWNEQGYAGAPESEGQEPEQHFERGSSEYEQGYRAGRQETEGREA
jgi:hypothetical protein